MKNHEIENIVLTEIKEPMEQSMAKAIEVINSRGFKFEEDLSDIGVWKDHQKNLQISITSTLSVSCEEIVGEAPVENSEQLQVEDRFYEIAEEGTDERVRFLAGFEGEIANGGFEQFFLNNDQNINSFDEAIASLQKSGSKTKMRLTGEAKSLFEQYRETLEQYQAFQIALDKLDTKYWRSKENIPVLYHKNVGL